MDPAFKINDDLMRYQDWGRIAYHYGAADTYTDNHLSFGSNPNNQPPGTVYIDLAMYSLYQSIFHPQNESTSNVYAFFLKLPNIIADIFIGGMIYYFVIRNAKRKYALLAASLFLYNPVIIYNSAVWGQTDALNNVFFFASLIFLFAKRYFLSVLMFFLSLYIKLSLLPLFPLLLVILLKKMQFNFIKVFSYIIVSIGILLLFTLPISSDPFSWLIRFFMQNVSGELQYITNYTFNFWSVIFNPDSFALVPLSSDIYFGLPLTTWAYILFATVFIPLLLYTYKQKNLNEAQVMGILFIAAFAVFLFLPRMHQRYIYPAIPLMATYIGLQRKFLLPYILLSTINFINLYVVWHPTDFLPVLFTNFIAHSKIRLGMSIVVVGLFLVIYSEILTKKTIQFPKLMFKNILYLKKRL